MSQMRSYAVSECASFSMDSGASSLSCRFRHPLAVHGEAAQCSQNLFVALACPGSAALQIGVLRADPDQVERVARSGESRADWSAVRVDAMRAALALKFGQDGDARRTLEETGDTPIVAVGEDAFWGTRLDDQRRLNGPNVLGRLLMERRDALSRGEVFVPDSRLELLGRSLDIEPALVPKQRIVLAGSRQLDPDQRREASSVLFRVMDKASDQGVCFEMGDNPDGVDAEALRVARMTGVDYRVWGVGSSRVPVDERHFVGVNEARRMMGHERWSLRDRVMTDQADQGLFLGNGTYSYANRPTGTVAGYERMRAGGKEACLLMFEPGSGRVSQEGVLPDILSSASAQSGAADGLGW